MGFDDDPFHRAQQRKLEYSMQGMRTAWDRRREIHPKGKPCAVEDPCERCKDIVASLVACWSNLPRWVRVTGRVTATLFHPRLPWNTWRHFGALNRLAGFSKKKVRR